MTTKNLSFGAPPISSFQFVYLSVPVVRAVVHGVHVSPTPLYYRIPVHNAAPQPLHLARECPCLSSAAAVTEVSTGITASANGWDTRTEGYGCAPSGCVADNVLDDSIEDVSRWSCKAEASGVEACELTLVFDEPQDILEIRIALYKGDQRSRSVNVLVDGNLVRTIASSGTTTAYEPYNLTATQATTIVLQAAGVEDNGWLSITGVSFFAVQSIDG